MGKYKKNNEASAVTKESSDTNIEDNEAGCLYLVATPIGNLGDITHRAIEILQSVDLLACEDTRKASILAKKFDIPAKKLSYFEHNEKRRNPYIIEEILSGKKVALITDAGTPGISDPGFTIVRDCVEAGINIIHAPGASALLTALVVSGLPTDRFVFEGFLPHKKGRKKILESMSELRHTLIFYESPHRIIRTLRDLHEVLGNRRVVLGRELTKKFEEIIRVSLEEAQELYVNKKPKGEYVIIVEGYNKK